MATDFRQLVYISFVTPVSTLFMAEECVHPNPSKLHVVLGDSMLPFFFSLDWLQNMH